MISKVVHVAIAFVLVLDDYNIVPVYYILQLEINQDSSIFTDRLQVHIASVWFSCRPVILVSTGGSNDCTDSMAVHKNFGQGFQIDNIKSLTSRPLVRWSKL